MPGFVLPHAGSAEVRAAPSGILCGTVFRAVVQFRHPPVWRGASAPTVAKAWASTRRPIAAASDGGDQELSCSTISQPA